MPSGTLGIQPRYGFEFWPNIWPLDEALAHHGPKSSRFQTMGVHLNSTVRCLADSFGDLVGF